MSTNKKVELAEPPVTVSASGTISSEPDQYETERLRTSPIEETLRKFIELSEKAGEGDRSGLMYYILCLFEDNDRKDTFQCWEGRMSCFELDMRRVKEFLIENKDALSERYGNYTSNDVMKTVDNLVNFGSHIKERPVYKALLTLTAIEFGAYSYDDDDLTEIRAKHEALMEYMKAIQRAKRKHPELKEVQLSF